MQPVTLPRHGWNAGAFQYEFPRWSVRNYKNITYSKVQEVLTGVWVYTLGYPNKEVETSLNSALLSGYGADGQQAFSNRLRLIAAITNSRLCWFAKII